MEWGNIFFLSIFEIVINAESKKLFVTFLLIRLNLPSSLEPETEPQRVAALALTPPHRVKNLQK
jgi:hypothetical protein